MRIVVTRSGEKANNGRYDLFEVMNRDTGIFYRVWVGPFTRGEGFVRIKNIRGGNYIAPHGALGTAICEAVGAK